MFKKTPLIIAVCLVSLTACKSGYNKIFSSDSSDVDAPDCAQTPSNPDLIAAGKTVFDLVASLSCNEASKDGALMGQSAGVGDDIAGTGPYSYDSIIAAFDTPNSTTDRPPAIISSEYEHDRIYTAAQLNDANLKLKAHWDAGGIIAVSWSPLNPWVRDEVEPAQAVGSRADLAHTDAVDLDALVTAGSSSNTLWLQKLDAVALRLKFFADAGIPVLWRPLPAPNSDNYWWGLQASFIANDTDNATRYTALWQQMHKYLTEDKNLNNLIWVYAPAEGFDTLTVNGTPVDWAYPGDNYVDVVGAIAQNDNLSVPDYEKLSGMGKPLGLSQYNPLPAEEMGAFADQEGTFDNMLYADRLESSYKNIAFWISSHSYNYGANGNEPRSFLGLIDHKDFIKLAARTYVLDLKTVNDSDLRD